MKRFLRILLFSMTILIVLLVPFQFVWLKMIAVFWVTAEITSFIFVRFEHKISKRAVLLSRNTGATIALFSLIGSIAGDLESSQNVENENLRNQLSKSYLYWGGQATQLNNVFCDKDDSPRWACSSLKYIIARHETSIEQLDDNKYFADPAIAAISKSQYTEAWKKVEKGIGQQSAPYLYANSKDIINLYDFTERFESFEEEALLQKVYDYQSFSTDIKVYLGYLLVLASAIAFASENRKEKLATDITSDRHPQRRKPES